MPARDSPDLPPRPLRWLFLDLNSYFASVEQQLQPSLRGRPVIVAPVGSDTTVAIAASVEAKRYGIRTGTPVWEAKRLCRELVVTPARHKRYVEFHDAIVAEIMAGFERPGAVRVERDRRRAIAVAIAQAGADDIDGHALAIERVRTAFAALLFGDAFVHSPRRLPQLGLCATSRAHLLRSRCHDAHKRR